MWNFKLKKKLTLWVCRLEYSNCVHSCILYTVWNAYWKLNWKLVEIHLRETSCNVGIMIFLILVVMDTNYFLFSFVFPGWWC